MVITRFLAPVIGMAAVAAAVLVPAAADAAGFAPIRNVDSHLCVQGQTSGESSLIVAGCNESPAQRWIFVPVPGTNDWQILNQGSGFCVYMNGPIANGSPVIQTGCGNVSNESWKNSTPPAITTIMSRAGRRDTNLCLTPEFPAAGALVDINTCTGSANQLWSIGV